MVLSYPRNLYGRSQVASSSSEGRDDGYGQGPVWAVLCGRKRTAFSGGGSIPGIRAFSKTTRQRRAHTPGRGLHRTERSLPFELFRDLTSARLLTQWTYGRSALACAVAIPEVETPRRRVGRKCCRVARISLAAGSHSTNGCLCLIPRASFGARRRPMVPDEVWKGIRAGTVWHDG